MTKPTSSESRLAAANALLKRVQLWRPPADQDPRTYDAGQRETLQLTEDIVAHLAAQPATALGDAEADLAAALDTLDRRVEYAIECGYVQHAAVKWLRDSMRTLRGTKPCQADRQKLTIQVICDDDDGETCYALCDSYGWEIVKVSPGAESRSFTRAQIEKAFAVLVPDSAFEWEDE